MRGRWPRWSAAIALTAVLAGAGVAAAQATTPAGARSAADPANDVGFSELASCLATASRLDALYVMDESGSLNETDPGGARFEAMQASVAELGNVAAESGGRLSVQAAVSAFGVDYTGPAQVKNWTAVPASSAAAVASSFRSAAEASWEAVRAENQGTNYQAALAGARASLLDRGSDRGVCRVVFWFTDGLFDIGDTTDQVSAAMCAPRGLLDQLRADRISLIALGLFNPTVAAQLAKPDNATRRGELKAMAVGKDAQRTCGTIPMPEGYRAGAYLTVGDSTGLAALFSAALAQSRGGTSITTASPNPVRVEVEEGVRSFQVDLTGASAAGLQVTPPGGTPTAVPLDGSAVAIAGGQARAQRFGDLTTATVSMPGNGTAGTWIVNGGKAGAAAVYLFSGIRLSIGDPARAELVAGKAGTLTVTATTPNGRAADLSVYKSLATSATARAGRSGSVPAALRVVDAAGGRLALDVTPPDAAASLDVSVSLAPTLRSGRELAASATSRVVPVTLPGNFPTVSPSDVVDLGTLAGVTPVESTLTLTGSADGPTRVCIGPAADVQVPERAGDVSITPTGCYDLAAGEKREVTVTVTPSQSADGDASAVLPITLTSAPARGRPAATADLPLDVVWAMVRPVDQVRRALLLLVAMLIAVLLPLLALWVVNRLVARFRRGGLQTAARRVMLDASGPRPDDGRALSDPLTFEWQYIEQDDRHNTTVGRGLFTLEATAPVNPFGGPQFRAVATPGNRIAGIDDGGLAGEGSQARVTPGLGAEAFVVVADASSLAEPEGPLTATVVLVSRSDDADALSQLAHRLEAAFDWTALAESFRRAAAQARPSSPTPEPAAVGAAGAPEGADDLDVFGPVGGASAPGWPGTSGAGGGSTAGMPFDDPFGPPSPGSSSGSAPGPGSPPRGNPPAFDPDDPFA